MGRVQTPFRGVVGSISGRLQGWGAKVEGHGAVGLVDLVRQGLCPRPDRFVVGEVRVLAEVSGALVWVTDSQRDTRGSCQNTRLRQAFWVGHSPAFPRDNPSLTCAFVANPCKCCQGGVAGCSGRGPHADPGHDVDQGKDTPEA